MDEYTAETFANRDEPVPLITVSQSDVDASSSEASVPAQSTGFRSALSSRLKSKGQDFVAAQVEKHGSSSGTTSSLQDKLFSKYGFQILSFDIPHHMCCSPIQWQC